MIKLWKKTKRKRNKNKNLSDIKEIKFQVFIRVFKPQANYVCVFYNKKYILLTNKNQHFFAQLLNWLLKQSNQQTQPITFKFWF